MKFYREKFREARKKLRWTTKALAEASNTSRQSISFWENGKKIPSEKKVRILAEVLDVKVSKISDLPDSHPVSKHPISEKVVSNNISETANSNSVKNYIDNIFLNLNKIDDKLSETSLILDAILNYSNNIIYIKDPEQNYVIANKTFLDNLNLKPDFNVRGKKDEDFYSQKDASLNQQQDQQVIQDGKPLLKHEQIIPGTRNQKWGITSKIPIFDKHQKLRGILGITVDITERKIEEKRRKLLEYAMSKIDGAIWIGKGINRNPGLPFYKEAIYTSAQIITPRFAKHFCGDRSPDSLSDEEYMKLWQDALPEDSKNKLLHFKKNPKFPITRSYRVISPVTKKEFWITENLHADIDNDIYIGHVILSETNARLDILGKAIDNNPKIIIWTGDTVFGRKEYKYSYMSNPEYITGFDKSYFLGQDHFISDLITDKDVTKRIKEKIVNDKLPFSETFNIKTKDSKEVKVESYYYKVDNENTYGSVYYGFIIDIS